MVSLAIVMVGLVHLLCKIMCVALPSVVAVWSMAVFLLCLLQCYFIGIITTGDSILDRTCIRVGKVLQLFEYYINYVYIQGTI